MPVTETCLCLTASLPLSPSPQPLLSLSIFLRLFLFMSLSFPPSHAPSLSFDPLQYKPKVFFFIIVMIIGLDAMANACLYKYRAKLCLSR